MSKTTQYVLSVRVLKVMKLDNAWKKKKKIGISPVLLLSLLLLLLFFGSHLPVSRKLLGDYAAFFGVGWGSAQSYKVAIRKRKRNIVDTVL